MSIPASPEPVTLVVAALLSPDISEEEALWPLLDRFGPVSDRLPFRPFTFSDYYNGEMGEGLLRGFWAFGNLVDPEFLAAAKVSTNAMEKGFAGEGGRKVNFDPGILSLTSFVLASGKPAAHRVYLSSCIWAEIEYLYRFKTFTPVEWTYPDYRDERVVGWFNGIRETLRQRRKEAKC